jgi:flavin-dependent dehydrogenase
MIRRSDFDNMHIQQCLQAGAKLVAPSRVVGIVTSEKSVDILTDAGETFRAKAVIGADGVNSVVAQHAGLRKKWQHNQLMLSMVAECPITPDDFTDQETIYILFGFHGLGYGWLFPKGNIINIGIAGMLAENKHTRLKTIYAEFIDALKTRNILSPSFKVTNIRGGLIPIKGVIPDTQTDRVLVCGDAAGFVNAITGEGIYYALVSGELAAKTLVAAMQQNDFSTVSLVSYQIAWQAELGEELSETVKIQEKLLTKPRLTNTVVHTVSKHDGMKRTFTNYFMGKISHHELKRSLMTHFLPQYLQLQAAKALRSLPFLREKKS